MNFYFYELKGVHLLFPVFKRRGNYLAIRELAQKMCISLEEAIFALEMLMSLRVLEIANRVPLCTEELVQMKCPDLLGRSAHVASHVRLDRWIFH